MNIEFHLENHAAHIGHLNLREEKHGEESVLAIDIKVEADVANDFLSYLSPTLKWSLYDKPEKQQDLIEDANHLPRLRYPEMAKDGGTIALTFRVQVLPTPKQAGALPTFLGKDTKISVRPAEEPPAK
jgi:hypothetical protein